MQNTGSHEGVTPRARDREPSATASTGVAGLDDIIRGGFPRNRVLLIEGDPGVGKTTLAMQYLIEGARQGERCLYVTLSETKEELVAAATSHGWSMEGIDIFELATPEALSGDGQNTLFHPSEVELAETTKSVVDICSRLKPQRVVFDSLSEIRLLAQNPLRYRREVLALKQYFVGRNATVLFLDDRSASVVDGHLQSIAHGVVSLDQLAPLYGAQRRRLRVTKLRGVNFRGGYHDFSIEQSGICVFPRLVAAEHSQPYARESLSSGVKELDAMLGGGLDRGTSALFLGPAGTGKSSLATQWAAATAERGEKVAIYAFDESQPTLAARAASLGIDIVRHRQSGQLLVRQVDPAEVPPGQFSHEVRESVEKRGVRLLIIDSLNGYLNAMPDESFLLLQLHELLTYLGQQGVVTILVVAQHGLVGTNVISPTDVSYLADTVVLCRHFELDGALHKAVSVLKKRTGPHESEIRELRLGSGGVSAGQRLFKFRGILSGITEFDDDKVAPLGLQGDGP